MTEQVANMRRGRVRPAYLGITALATAALLTLAACGSGNPTASGSAGAASGAKESDPSTVTIGVGGSYSFTYLPTYIAESKGFLADALKPLGVKAVLDNFSTSVDATKAMLSGQTQYSASVASTMLSSDANGQSNIQAVAQFLDTDIVVMVARKGMPTDPSALVGKKWGIASFGANNQVSANAVLASIGKNIKSVSLVAVGPPSAYGPAMQANKIDVALTGEPAAETMLSSGQADVVLNLFDPEVDKKIYGGPYATSQLQATQDFINSHPQLTKALVAAHVKALRWIEQNKDNPAAIAAALPKQMNTASVTAVLQRVIPGLSQTGVVDADALNNTIKAAKAAGTMDQSASFDTSKLINNVAFGN
ncbi:MAG TPA: ABC transporter substrate-binding protein [Pseudonocardiaceae bacterium]|nr:ABC transporter substrate-binding protein [Pseudonocardiaceae bacterium]